MFKEIVKAENKSDMITEALVFLLNILIGTFLLRVFWNRSLAKHITVLKPISTLFDAFVLSVSIAAVRGI
jgi:hypothetical protein